MNKKMIDIVNVYIFVLQKLDHDRSSLNKMKKSIKALYSSVKSKSVK